MGQIKLGPRTTSEGRSRADAVRRSAPLTAPGIRGGTMDAKLAPGELVVARPHRSQAQLDAVVDAPVQGGGWWPGEHLGGVDRHLPLPGLAGIQGPLS